MRWFSQLLEEGETKALDLSRHGLAVAQGVCDSRFCATRVCYSYAIGELERDSRFYVDGDEVVSQRRSQLVFEGFTISKLYCVQVSWREG